ncbi:hypothetical protein H4219_006041 [Mycoemilia scoparia]|uniref:Uncharacterized protein n=1 Tax=Mycoemilia scoparia TaxID=417184 RepID=A0A9W8DN47_9FUNG|nr:hypothetical protein H4219_006041 [Mycoemilia scoparia]
MASTAPPREDEVVMGGTDQGPERAPPVSAPTPAAATAKPTKQIEFSFVSNSFKRLDNDAPATAATPAPTQTALRGYPPLNRCLLPQRAARHSAAHAVAEDLKASLFTGAPKVHKKKSKGKFSFPSKTSSFSSAGPNVPTLLRPTTTNSPAGSLTYSEVTMSPNCKYNKSAPMAVRIEGACNRAPALRLATLWTELPAFPGRGNVLAEYLKRVLTSDPTIR